MWLAGDRRAKITSSMRVSLGTVGGTLYWASMRQRQSQRRQAATSVQSILVCLTLVSAASRRRRVVLGASTDLAEVDEPGPSTV